MAKGLGRRRALQRGEDARRMPRVAREARLSQLRGDRRQRRIHRRKSGDHRPLPASDRLRARTEASAPLAIAASRGDGRDRRVYRLRRVRGSRLAAIPRATFLEDGAAGVGGPNIVPPQTTGWRSASIVRRVARPRSCSTISRPSTSPAATWRSGSGRWMRSAASIRFTRPPATTWTYAGGCWNAGTDLASARPRWSGIIADLPCAPTGASKLAMASPSRFSNGKHPNKFNPWGHAFWGGPIYSPYPQFSLSGDRRFIRACGVRRRSSRCTTQVAAGPWDFLPRAMEMHVTLGALAVVSLVFRGRWCRRARARLYRLLLRCVRVVRRPGGPGEAAGPRACARAAQMAEHDRLAALPRAARSRLGPVERRADALAIRAAARTRPTDAESMVAAFAAVPTDGQVAVPRATCAWKSTPSGAADQPPGASEAAPWPGIPISSAWDMRLRRGALGEASLRMVVEHHGGPRRVARFAAGIRPNGAVSCGSRHSRVAAVAMVALRFPLPARSPGCAARHCFGSASTPRSRPARGRTADGDRSCVCSATVASRAIG